MTTKVPNYTQKMIVALLLATDKVSTFDAQAKTVENLSIGISDVTDISSEVLLQLAQKSKAQLLGKLSWLSRQPNAPVKSTGKSVYIKKVYANKVGSLVVSKSDLVSSIEKLCDNANFESLEKSTKETLKSLLSYMQAQESTIATFEAVISYHDIDMIESVKELRDSE